MTIPERVYHYTSKATALEHILPTKRIRVGSLGLTNDPRETKEWGFPVIFSRGPDAPRIDFEFDAVNQLNRLANQIRKEEWWVLCATRDDDNLVQPEPNRPDLTHFKYGCSRARMWAQYAENHRCVCLELDGPALHSAIIASVGDDPVFCGAIRYADEWDMENLRTSGDAFQFMLNPLTAQGVHEGVRAHIRDRYEHFFLVKSRDWATELEFRWLVNSSRGPFFVNVAGVLRSVIVGFDFPAVYGPTVWRLCQELGAKAERMHWWNRIPVKSPWEGL